MATAPCEECLSDSTHSQSSASTHRCVRKAVWPNAVGDEVTRASCIIKWWNPDIEVIVHEYKATKQQATRYLNKHRVILFVDKAGFVAVTPYVG